MANKPYILVVDDDPLNTKTLVDVFLVHNIHADATNSGQDALRRIKRDIYEYECVLSDICMPKISGVDLLWEVKRINPDLPFILMTAYANDDLVMEGVAAGALMAMIKPLDIDRLILEIRQILNH